MRKSIILVLTISMSAIFYSCAKSSISNDDVKPTIEVIEPSFEATAQKDTLLRITTYFRDDIGLKSCSMTIGDADGNDVQDLVYSYTEAYEESSKNLVRQYTYGDNIEIPSTLAASEIYLHFKAVDQNDNTEELSYKVNIE